MPTFHYRPLLLLLPALAAACSLADPKRDEPEDRPPPSILNLAHLDHLGEDVSIGGTTYRIVHIYADAPSYEWVGDSDEGIACVDDAARAAVVYLRHYETTGREESRRKAEALLRFVMHLQAPSGLFYNFVWDNQLRINTTHPNSRADAFSFWAARAVWALGTGARVLEEANPDFSRLLAERVARTYPQLDRLLQRYGQTTVQAGRTVPLWLVGETAADATSEMLLGLAALQEAYPDAALKARIDRFGEGVALMRYGSMNAFPYGAHASWREGWHAWGNSQTQALAEIGLTASAVREAEEFYPRLLVLGWLHSIPFDAPGNTRAFEQIAYGVRCVAVGLIRLHEATGEARYARMAGLAASWLTGNNVTGQPMYEPARGLGFDGINAPDRINRNSGAESTIEALFTVLEVEQVPEAAFWMHAKGAPPVSVRRDGSDLAYRVFTAGSRRLALVMNLTENRLDVLEGAALDRFLAP